MSIRVCYRHRRTLRTPAYVLTIDSVPVKDGYYVFIKDPNGDLEGVVGRCFKRGIKYWYRLKLVEELPYGIWVAKWVKN